MPRTTTATEQAGDMTPELLDAPNADQQFSDAIENAKLNKRPRVRLRVLLQFYVFGKPQRYKNWKGVLWRMELEPTVLAGSNFRAAFSMFLQGISTIGPAKVIDALSAAMKEGK